MSIICKIISKFIRDLSVYNYNLSLCHVPQFLWLLASPANMQTNCFQFASPQTSVIIERLKQWFYWQIKASYTAIIGLNETPRNLIQYYQLCLSAKGRGRMELSRSIQHIGRLQYGYLLSNTIAAFDEAAIKCRFRIKTVLLNTQFHCRR